MENLFLNGDPRFLAGAKINGSVTEADYGRDPEVIQPEDHVFTAEAAANRSLEITAGKNRYRQSEILQNIVCATQSVHSGKHRYHGRPKANVFLLAGDDLPTAGVELETVKHDNVTDQALTEDLVSNWFHFERDGSLGENGYECITEPLPARIYRDIRLWLGLQNALSPWTESWSKKFTGLHVHVGLNCIRDRAARGDAVTGCPVPLNIDSSVNLARRILAVLYYTLTPENLKRAVFMRDRTTYCGNSLAYDQAVRMQGFLTSKPRSDEFINRLVVQALIDSDSGDISDCLRNAIRYKDGSLAYTGSSVPKFNLVKSSGYHMAGHGEELNMEHSRTMEFRRGKGTLNGVTVHRMVEFTTLLMRYVEHVMYSPAFEVSQETLYKFICDNTVSDALKALVAQEGTK